MSIPSVFPPITPHVLPSTSRQSEQVILQAVQSIKALPPSYHSLSQDEITLLVKHSLWRMCAAQNQYVEYVDGKVLHLPKDLIIDIAKARAIIILKRIDESFKFLDADRAFRAINLSLTSCGISVGLANCYIYSHKKPCIQEQDDEFKILYAENIILESIEEEFPLPKTTMQKVDSHCQLFGLEDECTICNAGPNNNLAE